MKLIEFTIPSNGTILDHSQVDPTKLKNFIQINCNRYLKDMRSTKCLLFRGMRDHGNAFIAHSRNNRSATSNPEEIKIYMDNWFIKNKFTAIRNNSIFTSSDVDMAEDFGFCLYAIFPLDSASFSYSQKYNDLPINLESFYNNITRLTEKQV